jgi:hypothetical protein
MNEALNFNEDGAKRYADIHWPDGFQPERADFFAHNEIVLKASCKTVWDHLIEAPRRLGRGWARSNFDRSNRTPCTKVMISGSRH